MQIIKLPASKISHKNRNSVIRLNELRKIWNELMITEHPQEKRKIVGKQLRYLIRSEHGLLGGASFSCPAICLEDREKWFGWDAQMRNAYLGNILNMSRFLICNSIKCKNLASYCISQL
jgi:hypothetical protein